MTNAAHPALASLETLRANVDEFFAHTAKQAGENMCCAEGCSACCHVDLTVFAVEAMAILAWFESLPTCEQIALTQRLNPDQQTMGRNAAGKKNLACVFLLNNACTAYAARPLICRSQGLPLLIREEGARGEVVLRVDCCPLNFAKGETLPPQAEWLELQRLNTLLALLAQQVSPAQLPEPLAKHVTPEGRVALRQIAHYFKTIHPRCL